MIHNGTIVKDTAILNGGVVFLLNGSQILGSTNKALIRVCASKERDTVVDEFWAKLETTSLCPYMWTLDTMNHSDLLSSLDYVPYTPRSFFIWTRYEIRVAPNFTTQSALVDWIHRHWRENTPPPPKFYCIKVPINLPTKTIVTSSISHVDDFPVYYIGAKHDLVRHKHMTHELPSAIRLEVTTYPSGCDFSTKQYILMKNHYKMWCVAQRECSSSGVLFFAKTMLFWSQTGKNI